MPRGDGTGPSGMGPMTGRAAGYCAGYGVPGYASFGGWRGVGRGMGRGRGFGRGWAAGWSRGWTGYPVRQPFYAPPMFEGPYAPPPGDVAAQLSALRSQAKWMHEGLSEIEEQIRELEERAEE